MCATKPCSHVGIKNRAKKIIKPIIYNSYIISPIVMLLFTNYIAVYTLTFLFLILV